MLRHFSALVLVASALAFPATASAQVSRVGPTTLVINAPTKGSAVAYDPLNDRYLVVSSHGTVWGRLVSGTGEPLGAQFPLGGAAYGHYPRVAYSPHMAGGAGGFLVVWFESDTSPWTSVHARTISSFGVLGPDVMLEPNISFWEGGASVSYSTVSQEFLIAWPGPARTSIRGMRVSNAGTALAASFPIAADDYVDNPNLAYNPSANEWLLVHSGYHGFAYINSVRIKPGSGALLGANTVATAGAIYITDVAFNAATGMYLAAWYQPGIMNGRLLNADGSGTGNVIPLSNRYKAYDALSVARNPISGTFFAVSHDSSGTQDGGVELNAFGQPLTSGVQVTDIAGNGNYFPRLAASSARPDWYVSASNVFTSTIGQRITTATTGGGGGGQPPPPPPSCTFSLSSTSAWDGQFGGSGSFTLNASAGTCAWNASSNASWVTLGTTSGTGSSTISFTVRPNDIASTRTATITVASLTFTLNQAARTRRSLDFSGDNLDDIIWQNGYTGQLAVWRMRGADLIGGELLTPGTIADSDWKIMATIDTNGDGKRDLLWQHDSGLVAVWTMNGTTLFSGDLLGLNVTGDPRWRIAASGDLNGDGSEDILWQHQNGTVAVWYLRGQSVLAGEIVTNVGDSRWRIVGAGDFNLDGRLDFVWRHSSTGEVAIWHMNDRQQISGATVDFWVTDPEWEIVAVIDVDADGRPDFIWRNRRTGFLSAWVMHGAHLANGFALNPSSVPDVNWRIVGPK